jgi:Na+/H+ antiporter NhaD/arsenite permease-like protein
MFSVMMMLSLAFAANIGGTGTLIGTLFNLSLLFSVMMMLSLAFAANIGGTGTLIGTSPNLVFYGVIRDKCPGQPIK